MSEVLRRTVFIEVDNSSLALGTPHRPADWASVVTALGQMVEPFCMFTRHSAGGSDVQNQDFSGSMCRVDAIQITTAQELPWMLSGNRTSPPLHGGHAMPRKGA